MTAEPIFTLAEVLALIAAERENFPLQFSHCIAPNTALRNFAEVVERAAANKTAGLPPAPIRGQREQPR